MRTVICIAIVMMVQLMACTEDSVVGFVEVATDSCVPNQTFSCPCLKDGVATFGVQTCQADGISYSPCECSLVPMAPASPVERKGEEDPEESNSMSIRESDSFGRRLEAVAAVRSDWIRGVSRIGLRYIIIVQRFSVGSY